MLGSVWPSVTFPPGVAKAPVNCSRNPYPMKKLLFAAIVSTLSAGAMADGPKFAPLLAEQGFKFEPTVALTVGTVKPTGDGRETAYGVELNFNCGLLQTPDNRIRTHLSLSRVNGDNYDATILEVSPRYTLPLANGLSIGVGPSLGGVRINPDAAGVSRETVFAYGIVGGVNYRMGALYAGLDLGVRRTSEKNNIDFDSRYATLKVGINF